VQIVAFKETRAAPPFAATESPSLQAYRVRRGRSSPSSRGAARRPNVSLRVQVALGKRLALRRLKRDANDAERCAARARGVVDSCMRFCGVLSAQPICRHGTCVNRGSSAPLRGRCSASSFGATAATQRRVRACRVWCWRAGSQSHEASAHCERAGIRWHCWDSTTIRHGLDGIQPAGLRCYPKRAKRRVRVWHPGPRARKQASSQVMKAEEATAVASAVVEAINNLAVVPNNTVRCAHCFGLVLRCAGSVVS
jgi:hypothetical protein